MSDLFEPLKAALRDRYSIESEIGSGGMAVVYRATDLKHARPVALKVLRPEISASMGGDRFLREIQLVAKLTHPHVLPLHDSGQAGGLLYYVMPFIEGESLRDRLDRDGPLPIVEALRIVQETGSALDYAHERGIVHRDIKPGNILLSGGHAVVTDFGIARALDEAGGESLTRTGLSVGTPAYMSPEQAAGEQQVDARSDIYALACVLYEMLAGQPPFSGSTRQAVMARHVTEVPAPITERRPGTPREAADALAKALAKSPDERHASASEFAADLVQGTPKRTPTERRRLLALPVLIASAAAVAWLVVRSPSAPRDDPASPPAVAIDENAIAIFPLHVVSSDTSLDWFAEGLGTMLQHVFDGESGPRAADPLLILRAWEELSSGGVVPTADEMRSKAAELGYDQVFIGSVSGTSPSVRVTARIENVRDGRVLAEDDFRGSPDSVMAIVDSLGVSLAGLSAGEPSDRVQLILGTSETARRAYLAATRARRAGRYAEAREAYLEALHADSTFALAALGLYQNGNWCVDCEGDLGSFNSPVLQDIIWNHRERLPHVDRLIAEAWGIPGVAVGPLESSRSSQLEAAGSAVVLQPDRYEALLRLGDLYLHSGAELGIADHVDLAWDYLVRAFESDTLWGAAHAESVNHLVDIAILRRDTTAVRTYLPLFDRDGREGRFVHAMMAADALGDEEALDSLRVMLGQDPKPPGLWILMIEAPLLRAGYEDVDYVDSVAAVPAGLRHVWALVRGRPAAALAHARTLGLPDRTLLLDGLYAGGDGAAADSAAMVVEAQLVDPGADPASVDRAEDACALAQWHLARDDPHAALPAISMLREVELPANERSDEARRLYPDLCRELVIAWHGILEDSPGAREALAAFDDRAATGVPWWDRNRRRNLNLALSRAWEAAGEPERALAAIRRRTGMMSPDPDLAQSLEHEGRLAAEVGDIEGAIYAYEYHLELRSDPEPELLREVERVRAELAALK